jgi:hypothetical protein
MAWIARIACFVNRPFDSTTARKNAALRRLLTGLRFSPERSAKKTIRPVGRIAFLVEAGRIELSDDYSYIWNFIELWLNSWLNTLEKG